ncbi:hypothetical protein V6B16_15020 [Salinimicrobium catena]|uniref:hypothetical protein n=1 Tax=Salinimicrobium catena TaxID=390640 RepID=UPI002FE49996
MRKYLTLLLTCFALNSLIAQNQNHHIVTKNENSDWLTEFKNRTIEDKIEFLKSRFKDDQNVFFTQINPHGKPAIEEGFEKFTYYRPIYLFKMGEKDPIFLPGNPSEKLISNLQNMLTTENVESIVVKEDQVSKTVYGARGSFGIIEIKLNNLKTYSYLKKLIHNPA